MLKSKYFYFFNFMFLLKKKPKLTYNLLLLCTAKNICILLHMQIHNYFLVNTCNSLFIYKKTLLQSLFSYCLFINKYYKRFFFKAQYHLIGLTFSMGLDTISLNHKFFSFIVRMNQAHYTLFRLPTSVQRCIIERKGWLMRITCQNRTDFYYIVQQLHALRSLFPYKIKGFLFFSELPYQERNVHSGKQERKGSGLTTDKNKKVKSATSDSSSKYKKGRKV